jgi:hypothetical protein
MRNLRVTLAAAAAFFIGALFVCVPSHAQNYTTVTASNIADATGVKLASGQICFLGTDARDTALSFGVGGGGQVMKTPVCATVVNGVITNPNPFHVANPANTNPAGVLYHITVKNTATQKVVVEYSQVSFSGAAFNFDTYANSGAAVIPPTGGTVAGTLTVAGNASTTNDLTIGRNGLAILDFEAQRRLIADQYVNFPRYNVTPPPVPAAGDVVLFTTLADASNCTLGGGSTWGLCIYDGSAWKAVGGGQSLSGLQQVGVGSNTTIQLAITAAGTTGWVLIPSTYAGTDAFTNPNAIYILDLRYKASTGATRNVNIMQFGVVDDAAGSLDQYTKVQAAMDYADSVGLPLYGPCMTVYVHKPLIKTISNTSIEGPSSQCFKLYVRWPGVGPLIYILPTIGAGAGKFNPPTFHSGAITGNSQSYYSQGLLGLEGFNLRTMGTAMEVNGNAAMTVEAFIKPDGSGQNSQIVTASSGFVESTYLGTNVAWRVLYDKTNHRIQAGYTSTGGGCTSIAILSSANNSITDNVWNHVALTFNGSNETLWINGTSAATFGCTGTLIQKGYEDVTLGWGSSSGFLMGNAGIAAFSGDIGPVRFSNNARYSAGFTPATSVWTFDSNTLALINWDENIQNVIWGAKSNTMTGDSNGGYSYFTYNRPTGGCSGSCNGLTHIGIRNLRMNGPVIATNAIYGKYENDIFESAAFGGFWCDNNCYLSSFRDSKFYPIAGAPLFGLGLGPSSGLAVLDNVSCTAFKFCIMLNTSTSYWHGGNWLELNSQNVVGIVALNSDLILDGLSWSAENAVSSTNFVAPLLFSSTSNLHNLTMTGGNTETDYVPNFILNGGNVILNNVRATCFTHMGANPGLFRTGSTKPKVSIRNPKLSSCSNGWASAADMSYIEWVQGGMQDLGTVGGGTITVDPMNIESYKVTLSAALTTITVSNAFQGLKLRLTICQNGTGGFATTFPAAFKGTMTPSTTASKCNTQAFQYDGTNWNPLDAGTTGY